MLRWGNYFNYSEDNHSGSSEVKVSACNAGDPGLIPGLGRAPGEGNGTPLQYSCLENPMEGGAGWATVHRVSKSQTGLSDFTSTFTFNRKLKKEKLYTNFSPAICWQTPELQGN